MRKIILLTIILIFLTGCGKGIIPVPVDNEIVYRALLVGVGNYIDEDRILTSPPFSVDKMYQILSQCEFGASSIKFSIINILEDLDATKSGILDGIASTFSGADSNDISYFYYTGHGTRWFNTSYLVPGNSVSQLFSVFYLISVNKLESVLSAISGTKVVVLDTCFSGGFIGKGEVIDYSEEIVSFNDNVGNIFSCSEYKSLLTSNQYKVLTSCYHDQISNELGSIAIFTSALCAGCGYSNYEYPADINADNRVNLQEAYLYIKDWIIQNNYDYFGQDVQVYPDDSTYPVVEY